MNYFPNWGKKKTSENTPAPVATHGKTEGETDEGGRESLIY